MMPAGAAVSHVHSEETANKNIACALDARAEENPTLRALILPDGRVLNFLELRRECDRRAHALRRAGVSRGMRVALMVRPGIEFFALTFALFKLGAVVVLIDPGLGRKKLARCLAEASPDAFIGAPLAHAARLAFGWAKTSARILVTVGRRWFWGGCTLSGILRAGGREAFPPDRLDAQSAAAILFTSGSTGAPKGTVYSHGNFQAQIAALREHFEITPGEVDLPTFPLFALFAPALAMTSVIPKMDFARPGRVKPQNILEPILKYGVTQLFGSPALIDRVGRHGQKMGVRLPSLKRVICAGAPVPVRVIERFQGMLEDACQIHTPYGATEALPVTSTGSREILSETGRKYAEGSGLCVGRPVADSRIDILQISDRPIPAWSESLRAARGEVGEIVARGPAVTSSYFGRPEADAAAKIRFPDGTLGHRMGDVGYLDEQGRLWFCGRKSQRVAAQQRTHFTVACEGVFNRHPRVRRSALIALNEGARRRPAIVIELESGTMPSERLKSELLELGAARECTRDILRIFFHPSFPVDIRHNAKISRETLAAWANARAR